MQWSNIAVQILRKKKREIAQIQFLFQIYVYYLGELWLPR